jgi:hypothetical protein
VCWSWKELASRARPYMLLAMGATGPQALDAISINTFMILLMHILREQCHFSRGLAPSLVVHAPPVQPFPLKPRQRSVDGLRDVTAMKGLWVR